MIKLSEIGQSTSIYLWVKLNGGHIQKVLGWSSPKVSMLIT